MNKLFILISSLLVLYGCEKEYDSVIEPVSSSYQVLAVTSFQEFNYVPGDSTETLTITFNSTNNIAGVSYDLLSPDGSKVNSSPLPMVKADQNNFQAILQMSRNYINGEYTVKYYVTDISGEFKEAAIHKFLYNNGTANEAPVIANALVEPDTLVVTAVTPLIVTVEASDPDGQSDLEIVYFIVFRPDGTTSGSQNILSDDGNKTETAWDETANDGIFSLRISVNETNAKGTYRFEFRARDRGKKYSNIINYNVVIQ
jgi:hypothetical protein